MPAYLIVHRREIKDAERLKKYAQGVEETIRHYGGKAIVRADAFQALEGDWHPGRNRDDSRPERVTVIEFPDLASLRSWYDSKEYAPLKRIRQEAAVCDVAAVEGRND